MKDSPPLAEANEIYRKLEERAISDNNDLNRRVTHCRKCRRGDYIPTVGSGHPLADIFLVKYQPHYLEVTNPGQVQIYEAVMGDPKGAVTTGLLSAVTYLKDNRILPKGFDKATASKDIAVRGHAASDGDFGSGSDRVRYVVDVSRASGPFTVEVDLNYQTIAYRWARNLAAYKAAEPERFVRYYDTMAAGATAQLARASVRAD